MRAARIACVLLAVVACAWFALGARQAIDTSRAGAIVSQGKTATAAQEREVTSLVHAARLLNPDKQPDIMLGEVELEHGDYGRARRLLEGVIRSEPQNIEAWLSLAHASGTDIRLFYSALRHVHMLEPRVPSS